MQFARAAVMDAPLVAGLGIMAYMLVRTSLVVRRQKDLLAQTQRQTARLAAEREAILRSITEAMMVTDDQGRPLRTNQAFVDLMGRMDPYAAADNPHAEGRHIPLFHEDGRPFAPEELPVWRALRGETVENELIVAKQGDQQLYYLCNWAPLKDPGRGTITGTVALLRDVSGIKRLERLKDEFISTVSHELRTPLAVIKGYAELALLGPRLEEPARQNEVVEPALRKIIGEVEAMSGLIHQMLQIARLESDRMVLNLIEIDLVDLIATELGALTVAQACGRVQLDLPEAGEAMRGLLDRSAMRQILTNLVSNAVKYSPKDAPVVVRLRRAGGEALLSVTDCGTGIPEDELPLVFERFYRSENALKTGVPGLGLGLHITSRLVTMLGGRISVESRQGKGSTFTVALPLLTAFSAQPGATPLPPA